MTAEWTTPKEWTVDELVTPDKLNTHLRNNLDFLYEKLSDIVHLRDEKASGTNGGTFTSGTWQTRDVNTEVLDSGENASLSSNQIILEAGTYECWIDCPALHVGIHQARLQNVSDSTTLLEGNVATSHSNINYPGTSISRIMGRFTLAASKTLEIQHRCTSTKSSNGYGAAASFDREIYTNALFRKVR